MFIDGIGIAGYRSFGPEVQRIGPFKKINLFVGQNNSGKSNILSFLTKHYEAAVRSSSGGQPMSSSFDDTLDRPKLSEVDNFVVEFGMSIEGQKCEACLDRVAGVGNQARPLIERIVRSKTLAPNGDVSWVRHEAPWGERLGLSHEMIMGLIKEDIMCPAEWRNAHSVVKSPHHGAKDIEATVIPELLGTLKHEIADRCPSIEFISAIRKVGGEGNDSENYSGGGIIRRLAQLKDPDHDEQHLKKQYELINEFLRTVTENRTIHLEIPHKRDKILVDMDGKVLPLQSLGTGIHEVLILAVAATIIEDSVVCIEEPELHLHPALQKKLVRYLKENTDNQYFISTHSAHLLDVPDAAVFRVRLEDKWSIVENAFADTTKREICHDLGYRASDLLQTNCVVWVEGPSDRIYLNHWIHALDPTLTEGLHYSIMFFAGDQLRYVTASDQNVGDFISLRRLNQNAVIVMDKDFTPSTMARIKNEFGQQGGFAWVTAGIMIENYVEPATLAHAVRRVHGQHARLIGTGKNDRCTKYVDRNGEEKDIKKPRVAREVCKSQANLARFDLNKRVKQLVDFIKSCND